MQYLLLIYEAEEIWANKTEEEKLAVLADHGVLHERLQADGIEHSGEPLMPTATAVSLRHRGGELQVSDGPFAETKEQLAGFYLVNVESVEQAMEYAALIPHVHTGTIEVRPVDNHEEL
ncbi:MAG: YciI family protein [Pseudomonadota bacterium]